MTGRDTPFLSLSGNQDPETLAAKLSHKHGAAVSKGDVLSPRLVWPTGQIW